MNERSKNNSLIKGLSSTVVAVACLLISVSCGKVNDTVAEVKNDSRITGHWLLSESEHSSTPGKLLENESVVLTFKDGKAGFSPTDSVKGQAVYATFSHCLQIPRTYKTDKDQLVFLAEGDCPERRVTIQQLDDKVLKFPDPDHGDVTRVLTKIDDNRYFALVKASDRKP